MNLSDKFNTYVVYDPELAMKYMNKKTVSQEEKRRDVDNIIKKLREAVYKSFPYEPAVYDVTHDFPAVCIKTTAQEAKNLKRNLSGLQLQRK